MIICTMTTLSKLFISEVVPRPATSVDNKASCIFDFCGHEVSKEISQSFCSDVHLLNFLKEKMTVICQLVSSDDQGSIFILSYLCL